MATILWNIFCVQQRNSYIFRTTWRCVNDNNFNFGWTMPLSCRNGSFINGNNFTCVCVVLMWGHINSISCKNCPLLSSIAIHKAQLKNKSLLNCGFLLGNGQILVTNLNPLRNLCPCAKFTIAWINSFSLQKFSNWLRFKTHTFKVKSHLQCLGKL